MTPTIVTEVAAWILDASVFVHFCVVRRIRLLFRMRSPARVPDYVYRTELVGERAQEETRKQALEAVKSNVLEVQQLTLSDVARIAALGPRRAASIGDLACAVLAERSKAGVLTDDRRARRWLMGKVDVQHWHDTEAVLIDAAHRFELTEHDLHNIENTLAANRYTCRVNLKNEFLMQRLARHQLQVVDIARSEPSG